MGRISTITNDQAKEVIKLNIDDPDFDFLKAKQMAKDKALEKCDNPMILSWNNSKARVSSPDHECGVSDTPFWIRYARGRGANLTIDFNEGEYVFMILKM